MCEGRGTCKDGWTCEDRGCVRAGGHVKHRDALSKTQGVEIAQGKMSFFAT